MALMFLVLGLGVVAPAAHADPPKCRKYNERGVCLVWVNLPPRPPSQLGPSGPNPQHVITRAVGAATGVVHPITVNGQRCTPAGESSPQPTRADPVWGGHKDGAIFDCIVPDQVGRGLLIAGYTVAYWAATPPANAPQPPDPRQLAQQAVEAMQLRPITIGVVPEPRAGSVGLVGMPNWMWVQNPTQGTFGPITRTAAAGGFSVTATGRVERVVWDMGDGPAISCGRGTRYEDRFGKQKSPTCGHVYTRQGRYPVSATSYWVIDWAGIGQAGTINLDLTQNTTLTIGESQVISR